MSENVTDYKLYYKTFNNNNNRLPNSGEFSFRQSSIKDTNTFSCY